MKKYLSLALVALAIITACICLVSCKNDETPLEVVLEELDKITFKDKAVVYNGKPKNITVTTRLQYNRLPSGIKVRYEGNGNIDVGEYEVKAIFSKDGVEIPEATKTAKLTIKKAVYDLTESLETFKDTTVYYNGQVQTLKVDERDLPKGVSVTYDMHNAEPKVAGEYQITAKFTHTDTVNYEPIPDQTVTLTIERKLFDTSGFSFNRTFTVFDGSKKSVKITGVLPEGLKVRYEGNEVISVGTHTVRAIFYTEDVNYQAPAPMVTTLTILNEDYSSSDALTFAENADKTGYVITGYSGSATYLILPETYNGKPVTEIANQVFARKSFTYVHMPDSITKIGANVFNGCTNLKELYLSSKLSEIGAGVFLGCSSLEAVNLPETLTVIPQNCFMNCTSLANVTFGSNISVIGAQAFKGCVKLDKIFLPKSVTTVTVAADRNGNLNYTSAPFHGTAPNFMVVLEDIKAGAGFTTGWATTATQGAGINATITSTALVLYNQSYEEYITNHAEFRNADKTDALAGSITLGSTPLMGFDKNIFEYTTFANINFGYPTVSVKAASPAALIVIEQATVANGGKAKITITSADGLTVKTYTINFKTIGEFTASSEVVNKNGADGVVTFVIDDGYEDTATFGKQMLQKYSYLSLSFATWTKDFATLAEQEDPDGKKSYVFDENGKYVYTRNEAKISFWNDILSGVDGRAEVMVHSHTHAPWGMNDDGGEYKYVDNSGNLKTGNTPKGSTSKEYYGAHQIIEDIFGNLPSVKNVGFITPGIGVQSGDKVVNGELIKGYGAYANEILKDCIEKNIFLGARGTFDPLTTDYTTKIVTKDTINKLSVRMNLPGLAVRDYHDVSVWTDYIDTAARLGGWAMFCIHEMDSSPNNQKWWISEDKAEQLFAYTADKNIWVASFSDAITYYIEWATAKVDAKYDSAANKISVSVTDGEDDNEIFNTALTVKVSVPVMWESAKCGEKVLDVHVNDDGSKFVYVDVVPDTEAVYLEMLAE